MSTQTLLLGCLAIALLLSSSSSKDPTLVGGARPAGKTGGTRTYGPAAPLPGQAPSGSPGGQTQGASILGALNTYVFGNADKIGAGIADVITAARATDTGDGDGSGTPAPSTEVPRLAQGAGSGAAWVGFGTDLPTDASTYAPAYAPAPGDLFAQDTSFDMAVPDFSGVPSEA